MIGKTLSHYKVLEKIGQGGMGEVYRAEDTNLSREVAIKVLPEQFTQDPQRLARFEREAKLLASLNHPNIAAIYGLEEANGVRFLALELVEGETLAERVAKGPVPVEEALETCRQIAEGVEAAHEKGVIHRDLKPANVKVTPEGKVKILDFGLAKAFEGETPVTDISQSPTLTEEMTRAGVILGTAAYMSPEQAKGKAVDKKADIFAFGAVLYELLTGKRAFAGETITETIAAVLKSEPLWERLPENTPRRIKELLNKCLRKDPHERLHDIADVRIDVTEAFTEPFATLWVEKQTAQLPLRRTLWAGLVGLLFGTLLTGLLFWNLRPDLTPQAIRRLAVSISPNEELTNLDYPAIALSPNGSHLVYVANNQLNLRVMDRGETTPIPGTQGAVGPFFSPDGQWVGFFSEGKLKKVSIGGGLPKTLSDAPFPRGGSWGSDDIIVFAPNNAGGLYQVSANGGTPESFTILDPETEDGHRWPDLLPGGRAVLFSVQDQQVVVHSLETGERRVVAQGAGQARYIPTGHLVYVEEGTLLAVPFDLERLEARGTPTSVISGVVQSGSVAQFAFSELGEIVYVAGDILEAAQHSLVWVDRQGKIEPFPLEHGLYSIPRLSPEGQRLVVERDDEIWIYNLVDGSFGPLTFEGANFPIWAPDGESLTFQSSRDGVPNLFQKPADGSGEAERLTRSELIHGSPSWSPDGKSLVYIEVDPGSARDIWILPLDGEGKPRPLLRTAFDELGARISANGRWLAYISNESGRNEIYVTSFPDAAGKWQISKDGGAEAIWNPNGRELFYRQGNKMMAVTVRTETDFSSENPRVLFEGAYRSNFFYTADYDVTPDGQRFVMIQPLEQPKGGPLEINVVLNWFEELERLVPTN